MGFRIRTYKGKTIGAKWYCILSLSSKKVGVGVYSVRDFYLVGRVNGLVTLFPNATSYIVHPVSQTVQYAYIPTNIHVYNIENGLCYLY